MWDHPFQWGSKRTGPDLARVGTKYNEAWHWNHMGDPRQMTPASIMPGYPWMYDAKADVAIAADKMRVLKKLGTPYTDEGIANAAADYQSQADQIVANLATQGATGAQADTEIVALIAYLMRLGRNLEPAATESASAGGK